MLKTNLKVKQPLHPETKTTNWCVFCKQKLFIGFNDFVIKKSIWQDFCRKEGVSPKELVCMFCFDQKRGTRINLEEFVDCPSNEILFRFYSWPWKGTKSDITDWLWEKCDLGKWQNEIIKLKGKHPDQDIYNRGKTSGKPCRACIKKGKVGYIFLNKGGTLWICDSGDSRHNVKEVNKII